MLVLVLLLLMAWQFYRLAEDYNQNKWLYAFISIIAYYTISFILGLIVELFKSLFDFQPNELSQTGIRFLLIILSFLGLWFFHNFLEDKWEDEQGTTMDDINQIGKNKEDE